VCEKRTGRAVRNSAGRHRVVVVVGGGHQSTVAGEAHVALREANFAAVSARRVNIARQTTAVPARVRDFIIQNNNSPSNDDRPRVD